MKVLFVNSLYWPHEIGGAERAVRSLAEGYAHLGGTSVVVCLSPEGTVEQQDVGSVRVHRVPLANIGFLHGPRKLSKARRVGWHLVDAYNPVMGHRLGEILDKEKPDVIEMNNLQGFSVAAWKAAADRDIPFSQFLHDYYLGCANSSMFKRGANCQRQCAGCHVLRTPARRLSSLPRMVSAVSRRTLARVVATGSIDPVKPSFVSRTPIEIARFSSQADEHSHKSGTQLIIGYLGRIEVTKGIETLIDAAAALGDERCSLLIAGEGDPAYVDDLRRRRSSPAIAFLGKVDAAAFLARIHLLVVPSLWEEPLSRVIPEAYASGVTVVASRVGGMPEIVVEGQTGEVFMPGNVGELQQILDDFYRRDFPSSEQRAAMRSLVMQFDASTILAEHMDHWRRAVGEKE